MKFAWCCGNDTLHHDSALALALQSELRNIQN